MSLESILSRLLVRGWNNKLPVRVSHWKIQQLTLLWEGYY